VTSTDSDISPSLLEDLEPTRYYAVWQHVEQYYAFMGFFMPVGTVSFLMVGVSREAAECIRDLDALQNDRGTDLYEICELSLADALAAARSRPLPIRYPGGDDSYMVGGLALFDGGSEPFELVPL
jgi:hypothetical protein